MLLLCECCLSSVPTSACCLRFANRSLWPVSDLERRFSSYLLTIRLLDQVRSHMLSSFRNFMPDYDISGSFSCQLLFAFPFEEDDVAVLHCASSFSHIFDSFAIVHAGEMVNMYSYIAADEVKLLPLSGPVIASVCFQCVLWEFIAFFVFQDRFEYTSDEIDSSMASAQAT